MSLSWGAGLHNLQYPEMVAMASLGHSGCQLGSSLSPPCNKRHPLPSRDVVCASNTIRAYLNPATLSSQRQQRLAVLKNGANGMKNDAFASREKNFAICRPSGTDDIHEGPKLVARFPSIKANVCFHHICHCKRIDQETESPREAATDAVVETWGIQIAIAALKFYKREISPLLPGSCRYVPTCSEYSMQAYRTYGVLKGTVLTAWRLARCNPFGGSGFDPPRWFGEPKPPSS